MENINKRTGTRRITAIHKAGRANKYAVYKVAHR